METTDALRPPRRLARPHEGRWLGGVAAALGGYFDLSPTIYRIAFVALALAGGTGILLYAAAWLVIPEEGTESSHAERFLRDHTAGRPSRAVALGLLAFFVVLGLSSARWWPTPGNLWLALALAFAAFVWWEASPRGAAARVPTGEGDGEPVVAARRRSIFGLALGSLLAAAGIVALLETTGAWHADWPIVLGAMVVLTGAVVVAGAAAGMRVAGTAGLGIVLLAALALALTADVPLRGAWGDHTAHPRSLHAVATTYRHGVGKFQLDLSDVAFPAGSTHVEVTLGIGNLRVVVPPDVTVDVTGHVRVGHLRVLGSERNGVSVDDHAVETAGSKQGHVLILDARVGLGRLEVTRG
ncbi:MAG: PspC domain-containing protein [Gaiellaceae bacterium]